ncbi:large proline-rich protein BAG6-like [Myxocyprinus asiaticus]|uniref:large proline-rich protein BAG6-like n=1 Tax=Myxocyprinus asiaticus TaxID=70543 RepID=UPI002221F7E3|nr:large proline-rich protein BAG6-like [Myxocyprinus asiaticus]
MMEEPGTIAVTVKTLDSQSRTFTVRGEWTVKQFKEHITFAVEIPVDKQRLIYQGKVLQDERTLAEYNVEEKAIHLVEPRQSSQSGCARGSVSSSSGAADGGSTSSQSSTFSGASHNRNSNNYVMLGTFNLPVNIMDQQKIQMSVQQMLAGVREMGQNVRLSTSTGSSGSVDVHINVDQSMQSEPRMRLQLAENLLRENQALIHRLEGQSSEVSSQQATEPPSSSSSTSQTEGPTHSGPNNPSPLELVEVLSEVRRVEERLRPFMERTHSIFGAASSADYNNNTQEREEDQCTLNLIGESLHLLGNILVALSDFRCNLFTQPPHYLHVVRSISHYTSPVVLQSGLPQIPILVNLGSTGTMTSNDRQAQPSQPSSQSEQQSQGQAPAPPPTGANQQTIMLLSESIMGFFGDLLSLVCQSFSIVDMVVLLHGNPQPLSRIQPQLTAFFTDHYLQYREPTDPNITRAADDLINGLEEYIAENFSTVTVREGVNIIQTNMSFLRQQLTCMATHIMFCTDNTFGQRLLYLCTQGLFECLALNLYCLRGEQRSLITIINHSIRRMSTEVNPSLVNWLTSMMSMRLHVILEHNPVTEDQIQHYVIYTQQSVSSQRTDSQADQQSESVEMEESLSPAPATTAEEVKASTGNIADGEEPPRRPLLEETRGAVALATTESSSSNGEVEPWVAAVLPEWVPIIRHDMLTQRKMKAQQPLSDAYLHGMPAKRRKTTQGEGPHLSLSDAVSQAARVAGVQPVTTPDSLQGELEAPELQEAYTQQVKSDIKKRLSDDPDYNHQRLPNTHRAFFED